MSTYDDWVVNFKVNTAPIDAAIRRVNELRNSINNLHGRQSPNLGGAGGGRGGGRGPNPLDPFGGRDFQANLRALRQAQARRREYERAVEREAHAEDRWRNRQRSEQERRENRQRNFDAAVRTRQMRLDRLEQRMRRYGTGNRTELANLRQALGGARSQTDLNSLAPRMNDFLRSTNQSIAAQARLERQMQRNSFVTRSMSNSMANFARSYLSVFAVIGAGSSIYKNAKEMENLQTKLLMGTGSRSEAASAYGYIKERAKETGSDLFASTNLYAQMAITAKDAGLNKSQIKKIYEDTTTMSIGYGLNADQQKLVTKAIVQMMSKGSVQAEEFRHQLGDQAPGVMNALLQVMDLQPGQEGMAKLTKLMKQGKIPVEKLFEFLDLIAKRAKETGAYDLAINSKTATENRMTTSYRTFAEAFGRMFDEEIKAPFKGFEKFFDRMTAWIDEQEKLKKETGEIGKFETSVSLVTSLFSDLGTVLQGVIEGWSGLFNLLPGTNQGGIGGYLAKRQLDSDYKTYSTAGGNMSKREYARQQFFTLDPFNTDKDFDVFANNIDPTGSLASGFKRDPILEKLSSMFDSLIQSSKDSAQALIDAKYNNPLAPPVTINIQGATDPMANAIAVQDILKDQFRVPR